MKYNIENYKNGVVFINVFNDKNLSVVLSNYGAGMYALRYDEKPLILEIEDKDTWLEESSFYGKTLARVAGRIPVDGELDGLKYHLDETMADYCLHGGKMNSLSFKAWNYEIKECVNKTDVIFTITSKSKDCGFPGLVKLKVIYEIYANNNNFKIIYKGSTPTATLLNMSNHAYYNFNNSKDVSDYSLKVAASKYGEMDQTSFIRETNRIPWYLDFNRATKLDSRLDYLERKTWVKTIDNTFLFDEVNPKKPQVILKNSDFKLTLFTSYPTLNIFCDNFHKPIKFKQFEEETNGRRALALEPQLYDLDLDSIKLRKSEKYNHFILLKIKDLRG